MKDDLINSMNRAAQILRRMGYDKITTGHAFDALGARKDDRSFLTSYAGPFFAVMNNDRDVHYIGFVTANNHPQIPLMISAHLRFKRAEHVSVPRNTPPLIASGVPVTDFVERFGKEDPRDNMYTVAAFFALPEQPKPRQQIAAAPRFDLASVAS